MAADAIVYSFNCLWYDRVADLDRAYILNYYLDTDEIEMHDAQARRIFLRRCRYEGVGLKDIVVGSTVTIYSRQLKVVGFANEFTRKALGALQEKTCALIKPHALMTNALIVADALQAALARGLRCARIRLVHFQKANAEAFYAEHLSKPFYPDLQAMITAAPACALELVGPNAVSEWRDIIGPTDPSKCEARHLRKKYGESITCNAFHGSASPAEAEEELKKAFSLPPVASVDSRNKGVLVVLPKFTHLLSEIVIRLQNFLNAKSKDVHITGMTTGTPTAVDVRELLAAYEGVISRWADYVDNMSSGPVVAIEVSTLLPRDEVEVCSLLRTFAGAFEPIVAKQLHPGSLRAEFGEDAINNCVFVTDLPEEGEIHSDFWFRVMWK